MREVVTPVCDRWTRAGFARPCFRGRKRSHRNERRRADEIAAAQDCFVFQRFNLLPTLSAKGNIAIAQFIHGDGFDPHRFDVVTKMLGLEGRLHHRPSELSGGEQQRVAIARAIINEPKILLADEPTGNLDSKNSDIVLEMLRQLNKDLGQTIVMITHNPEAVTYFDRVVHMRDGVIVDGVPAD